MLDFLDEEKKWGSTCFSKDMEEEEYSRNIIGSTWGMHIVESGKLMYNPSKIFTKEKTMSFAGIIFYNNRIIGFSDSKGSKINSEGIESENTERPLVKKMFWNCKFLTVFTGQDEYIVSGNKKLTLEELVPEMIKKCTTPYKLGTSLYRFLRKNNIGDIVMPTTMVAGFHDPETWVPVCLIGNFTPERYDFRIISMDENDVKAYFAGEPRFSKYFSGTPYLQSPDEYVIQSELENAFEKLSPYMSYCSVGGPWVIQELK
ncbi:MAG: hypothetical protein LIP12_10015 [Clostridiales bacterium]|nr:hypothetical protein [Clostridiales bacterium]